MRCGTSHPDRNYVIARLSAYCAGNRNPVPDKHDCDR